jgi:hypothetical protein
MNYTRYSKEALDALAPQSDELKRRMVELAVDVELEMHATIAAKFREIVENLNSTGHELRETSSSKAGEIDYAQGEKPHPFYLCCDTVISSGYSGTSPCNAHPVDEEEQWKKERTMADEWERKWRRQRAANSDVSDGPPS